MKTCSRTKSKGFTLVELITVIVLLGILALVAVPRFINVSSDAHLAVYRATFSGFKVGVKLAHTKWLVQGSPKGNDALNVIDNIDFNSVGFPIGVDDGVQVNAPQDCADVFNSVLQTDLIVEPVSGSTTNVKNVAAEVDVVATYGATTCFYTFVSESKAVGYNARQFRYTFTTGEVFEYPAGFTLL